MKIRKKFVSNSSSSSFLIGIARISNIDKFYAYIKENDIKLDKYDTFVRTYGDITANVPYYMSNRDTRLEIESFMSDISIDTTDLKDNDHMLVVNLADNEGDSAFMNYDDIYGDIDYDIDLDFFGINDQKIFKMMYDSDSGIDMAVSNVAYGAGRNG